MKTKLQRQCAEQKELRKHKNPVGRPKGGNLATKAFNDAMDRGDVAGALDTLLEVAKDPDHRHWAAAQKFILDRVANATNYEKGGGVSAPIVNINISTAGQSVDIEDADYKDVSED